MTQIIPTVDFQQEGKQIGWLRVPHSVTRSAYGTLPLPIAVIRNGPGAQVMLSAGNHGGVGIDIDYPLHRYFTWATQIEHELGSAKVQLEGLGRRIASGEIAAF